MSLRIGVVGAGIGGLTLAHALRRRGLDCVVFDRDAGPGDTAGYRLHLTPEAYAALRATLPAELLAALREHGAGNDRFRQFAVLDHRGRTRLRIPMEHSGDVLLIDRRPLREILARGVPVRWGAPVGGFTRDGEVVRLDGGQEFDLLVAADGTGSRIARQWTGRPTAVPAGVTGIAGRTPLPQRIPADLRRGLAFMIGPRGVGAFLSLHPGPSRPSVVWAIGAAADRLEPTAAEARRLTAGWTGDFHALVDSSEAGSIAAFPFHFPAAWEPWPVGPVTLLGDAIHPMPPTAGAGASTAILDAAHLADDLARRPLRDALTVYQRRLLTYAPAAVDEARPALAWQRRLGNPLVFAAATELVLPLVDGVICAASSLRRRRSGGTDS